jgi:hypothetical protein
MIITQTPLRISFFGGGTSEYKSREDAESRLVKIGAQAYPAVLKASRSRDLEVARRAHKVASSSRKSRRATSCAPRWRTPSTPPTSRSTGRIVSPSLRARSIHFGDLRLMDLRQVHFRNHVGKQEITVDAAQYGSELNQWLDTEIDVESGAKLCISADGQVDLWPQGPGQYMTTPAGFTTTGKGGQHKAGLLLGRIGQNGKVFVVGDQCDDTPAEQGRLYLHIVPSPWNNASSGTYRVQIRSQASIARQ